MARQNTVSVILAVKRMNILFMNGTSLQRSQNPIFQILVWLCEWDFGNQYLVSLFLPPQNLWSFLDLSKYGDDPDFEIIVPGSRMKAFSRPLSREIDISWWISYIILQKILDRDTFVTVRNFLGEKSTKQNVKRIPASISSVTTAFFSMRKEKEGEETTRPREGEERGLKDGLNKHCPTKILGQFRSDFWREEKKYRKENREIERGQQFGVAIGVSAICCMLYRSFSVAI